MYLVDFGHVFLHLNSSNGAEIHNLSFPLTQHHFLNHEAFDEIAQGVSKYFNIERGGD